MFACNCNLGFLSSLERLGTFEVRKGPLCRGDFFDPKLDSICGKKPNSLDCLNRAIVNEVKLAEEAASKVSLAI